MNTLNTQQLWKQSESPIESQKEKIRLQLGMLFEWIEWAISSLKSLSTQAISTITNLPLFQIFDMWLSHNELDEAMITIAQWKVNTFDKSIKWIKSGSTSIWDIDTKFKDLICWIKNMSQTYSINQPSIA